MAQQLNVGDLFPEYGASTVDGKTLKIPADLTGKYSSYYFTVVAGDHTAASSWPTTKHRLKPSDEKISM